MPQQIVQLVYPALVLFFVLFALIVSDRAFPLRVRRMFYLMLLTSLILVLMDGSSGWLAGQGFLSGRAGDRQSRQVFPPQERRQQVRV